MKLIKKYLYILLCSIVLLLLAVSIYDKENPLLPSFYIQIPNESIVNEISIFDANDGNYYVFLPSYADMERMKVSVPAGENICIGDKPLSDNMSCCEFDLETPYALSTNGQKIATLWFLQSANVAAMHIDTATGGMKYIHRDKNYEESASVTLCTADGRIDYYSEESILKGRGNATWGYDKRPYSLTLPADSDLLDMGAATNWILLANAYDETNLNNKLVLEIASRVGLEWTPESKWIDVYLNGEYNGLYLLAEKVEIHENRLHIDPASGDFLCKIDLNDRWDTLRNPFLTASGRTVEISSPEKLTKSETDRIKQLVNQMEQNVLSDKNLQNSTIIDLDSWVCRYLIDEISGNIDSDMASSYFYCSNGVFFSGPIWDYDKVLGNCSRNQEPCAFIARNFQKSSAFLSPYYSTLYDNESFFSRIQDIYLTEFRPVLQQMLESEIDIYAEYINKSAQMNSLRWRTMYDTLQSWEQNAVHTPMGIKQWLSRRIDFLDQAWLENINYCTVQFEPSPGASYWNISVKQGTCLETNYTDIVSTTWVDTTTAQIVDFSQPIMTDMILTKQATETADPDEPLATRDYITILSVAALVALLAGFILVDVIHRRKERG